jgi:pimeloyl-ACP methyl ester carboxylesterase
MYVDEKGFMGMNNNQLWEPNRNLDVKKLYLNSNGSSTLDSIYVGGPLGKAYGIKDIYGKFMDYLNSLRSDKTINEWKAFGYDWRKPITEVVAGKENLKINGVATTSINLVDLVVNMASSSKTGKVTLIAHSNGGLVSKYLIKTLADLGKSDLIDKVISVAVPYLGTPQAILGLLHGDGESIAHGVILNPSVARGLGQNMSSAYSLLPSRSYFAQVFTPSIAFASTSINGLNNGVYPKEINSYESQKAFVLDSQNTRKVPKDSNTDLPIKGNSFLLNLADIFHGIIDNYSWPNTISKWSLVGWNNSTSKGITYSDKKTCSKGKCITVPDYNAEKTIMGDGTVVVPSATYDSGEVVSLDLANISDQEKREISHANILGASSTINSIDKIIKSPENSDKGNTIAEISKIKGATIGKPDLNKEPVSLVLSTHSPVDLHVYDSKGRHVGINPNPQGLNQQIEDDIVTFTDEDIPGSSINLHYQSDGSRETYVYLPDNNGERYSVMIDGNSFGEFTYQIERKRGSEVLNSIEYTDIPVTPLTVASTSIVARVSESVPVPDLASSSPVMRVDIDGNGSVDISANSNTKIDYLSMTKSLKKLLNLSITDNKRKDLINKRLDKIEDKIKKGKLEFLNDYREKLNEKSKHIKLNKITNKDKEKLVDSLETYISQFE